MRTYNHWIDGADHPPSCGGMIERRSPATGDRLAAFAAGTPAAGGAYDNGLFFPPTIFVDVTPEMTIWREEIFGPVASVMLFDGVEEAVAVANDTAYGLANGVWTRNLDKALAVTRRLRSGMVYVNCYLDTVPQLPFGGMKESGVGRENGVEGLLEFMEVKAAFAKLQTSFDSANIAGRN